MSLRQKLRSEISAMALITFYFAAWLGFLVLIKKLILSEYQIEFHGLSMALVGALVLAKVVLVLEHVPLGSLTRARPAMVDVFVRTLLYAVGVFLVLLFEKALEGRIEHGGFVPSLISVFQHAKGHHVWVNSVCLTGALLGYNAVSVVRRHLDEGGLTRLFMSPIPEGVKGKA